MCLSGRVGHPPYDIMSERQAKEVRFGSFCDSVALKMNIPSVNHIGAFILKGEHNVYTRDH